jgi:hypothetical protein
MGNSSPADPSQVLCPQHTSGANRQLLNWNIRSNYPDFFLELRFYRQYDLLRVEGIGLPADRLAASELDWKRGLVLSNT